MTTIKETTVRASGAMVWTVLRTLAYALALAMVGTPVVSWAQQVPDAAAGAHRPTMDSAANGVPVVDIVAPNAQGVSHNKYQRFDVDKRGVILNNSAGIVRTQLGGYVAGNDNLKGGEASLILNEVTSALPSTLNGYIEVGGKPAAVVIANPYGITCDGCGIINSQRFTLTTGTPVFGGSGSLDAFHVTGGGIAIGSGGLDGSVVDRTDLIARAVQLNGKLWAKQLDVVTGSNDVGYTDASVRANAADASRPAVSIDVAALGGMYADKIRLVGTEAGVGVVSSGAIAAQAGDLQLSSAGEVRLGGTAVALNDATLDAAGPITIDGSVGTQNGNVSLSARGPLTVNGGLIAGGSLAVNAATDVDVYGRLSAGRDLTVYAGGRLRNMGLVYTDRSFDLRTGSLANGGTIYGMEGGYATAAGVLTTSVASTLHAGSDLSVDAGTLASDGVVDAGTRLSVSSRGDATLAGAVQGGGDVSLRAAGLLDNAAVAVSGAGLAVQAGRVVNRAGGVVSSGADLVTTVTGDLANQGTLYAVGGIAVNAGTLTQAASGQIYGIGGARVDLAGALDNAGSLVGASGLAVTAQGIDSRGELGTQQGDATLVARGDMTLAGTTVAGGALTLRAAGDVAQQGRLTAGRLDADVSSLDNAGDIYARGDASVRVAQDVANAGSLYADGGLTLDADGKVGNGGTIHAGSDLALHAASLDSGKQIDAGRDLIIDAAATHLAGNVQAGRDLSVTTAGTLTSEAEVVAGRDATVHAGDLGNTGSLSASRDLALTASGDVNDTGKLYAGRALTVDANALTVGDKASVSAADTVALRLRGALRSTGSVVGANGLTVDAGTIDSSGSLGSTQGSVRLTSSAGDIHLGGTVSAATAFHGQSAQDLLLDGTLTANAVDLVAARTMTLAGSLHATGDAAIDAGQDLLLAGDTFADGALAARSTGGIHQSGTTHAGGDLSLDATTIDGEGTLDAGNDLAMHADTATLGGRMQAGRDVRITAGTLTQTATVVAARDAILGAERFDGRKGGTISAARDLTLTVAQDATDAGLLFAGNVLTLGANTFTQTADGRLDGTQGLVVTVDGALESDGAIVGGNGVSLTAGSLRSGGQLGSKAGDVSLTTTRGDLSLAGITVSAGRLDATSASALAQTGAMNAHATTLTAAGDIDLAGDTSIDGALALDAGRDVHNTGSVYATGTLDAHASGDLDNRGDIAAEQDLKARADGSLTQDANGKLQTNGTLTVSAARIDSAGTLAAAHDVGLSSQGDTRLSGTTQAGGALDVQAGGALTNAGKLLASSALSVEAASVGNTGDLSTDGTLALHATGAIDNQGTVYAGKALDIGAGGFTQGTSAELSGADTVTIDVTGAMTNAGKLVAARTLDVKAGSLSSTGTLGTQQGDMHLLARQGDLVLGGTVASAADLDARAAGAIRQSGQLAANGLTLHADGDLAVQGDIAAKTATLSSGATLSQAGTVSAEDISLDGVTVTNAGRTLSSGDLRVHGATVDAAGTLAAGVKADGTLDTVGDLRVLADGALTAHGSLLAGNLLQAQANTLDLSYGTQRAGGNANLLARTGNIDHTAADLGAGGSLTVQAAGALVNRGVDGRDARMQANALLLTAASIDNTRGKLLQSGSSVLVLRTAGTIDNTGGTIVNNGSDLTLHGSRVVNTGGSVQLAGNGLLDVGADQDVDNRQGTLASNGTTHVAAATALANDGGLINAHGNTTVSAASLSNTANGAISGATLGVTVTNGLNNTGGLLQATGGNLGVTAANLSNGGGTIQSAAGATTLGIGGTLDNGNGTIAAGGGTTLTTARLINAGTISGAQLNVQATDTVANSGRLQSLGALDLRATNGLNNNGGRVEANGTTTLASASISNIGGRIANASAALTQVNAGGGIDNRGGTLGGQGDVSLSGTSISNAQGGTLVAANNLTLGTGQLDNGGGTVYAGNTFNFTNAGASASNVNGKITAGRQLNLTLFGFDNSGGTVQAGIDGVGGVGNVMLDIRNLVGQGTIVANNTLGMHLVGDYVQAAGSSIKATGGFSLAVDGQFTNNGSIQAVNGLTISAAGITNNAGALLNSANTQLVTGGTVTNAGSIQGNTVGINAGMVNNTGSIMGGNVTLQAGTVINGADFGQSIGNPDYQSGTIAATNSVDIYTGYLLNRDAQIFSLGNINVAGAGRNGQGLFDMRAGQIDNISGSIQAQGSILLAANQINNVRRVLSTTSRTLTAEESAASQPLPITDYKHAINKVQEYETWTEYHTLDETVVNAASAQSQIVAGGNISLYGSVKNNTSTIAANGFLAVNQQGAGGGTGMVAGNENVSNESLAAGRTIQKVAVTHHIGCGTDQSLCDNAGGEKESYSYRPDTDPSDLMHDNYTALGAVMSGAAGVAIGGLNVSNGGVTPDGRSVGNTRLDPNAQAIGLSSVNKGNAQGATGLPPGAQVDPATGHAPQVLGGAGQPLAGVTLPTGGIYSVRGGQGSDGAAVHGPAAGGQIVAASAGERSTVGGVDAGTLSAGATGASARNVGLLGNAYLTALLGHAPSGNYLIETNARFADYSQFISSDYLLDKLGVDPARTMMRLGDGFYEQQLVVNQVTQLTGRAYLSDYGSGLDEYQALMNNGAHAAQAMNLSVGVALTAAQVSALTQDIVWMVQQNVDGHDLLVPVVYLASGNLGLTAQGAVIAGKDVSIDASGTLSNDGTIRGQNSTLLTAKDLLNSGRISSDGLTAISATGNITNVNGRIDGAGVSLVAGGDIRSENVGGLIGSGLAPASITATQGLQINAGHDLSLDHTTASSGGDALLTAGHDLTLAGKGITTGGSLALAAGHDVTLASSTVTTQPSRWTTGTRAEGVTLDAGKDLSVVAGNDLNLSVSTLKAGGDAALQAGHDLTLGAQQTGTRWTTQTQGSSVTAGGSLSMQAGHDLSAQAATVKAGGDMALLAGHDLSLTASTDGTSTKVTHQVTGLEAGGNLAVAAGNDALLEGTTIKAGGTAALQAGNDLTLTTVTDSSTTTASWKEGKKHITQTTTDETVRGVTVDAGKGVQIAAGHDATLDATTVSSGGDITVAAGHDLTLGAEDETHTVVTDTKKKKSGLFSSKTTTTHDTSNETLAVGTTLSGDNVHLVAGNDLTAEGAAVKATGDIALAAGHDVNLLATTDSYSSTHDETVKKSGFTLNRGGGIVQAGKKTVTNDDNTQHVATGTLLSGDSISVAAGHDVLGEGAKIAGTHDVTVAAGNDLNLTTAVDVYDDSHSKTVTQTGYSRSGMTEVYGQQKDSRAETSHQVTHTGSVVGSTDGQVTLTSGGNLHLTGTDVISQTGTTIVGKNVTIDADTDTLDITQSRKHSQGGVTGGLAGGLYDLAMETRGSTVHASHTDDDRLKAVYAAQAAMTATQTVGKAQDVINAGSAQGAAAAAGVNVQVGIGGSSVSSKTSTHDDTSFGGHITSGGNVTIGATGGDLTLIGADISGKNVALAATNDINLLSQSEGHSLKNESKNSAGSIGVSFGTNGLGIYASASVGSGKAHGNGETHAETTINADDKLTIVSGHDTTIEGAQLKGQQVVADIGNNLTIRSEQDTDDYASKTMQAGGQVMVGITQSGFVSGSAYYAASKVDSHYTGVNEVSGIKAGDGGFQIDVGGTTHLVGGQIASAADASKNVLSTGDLVWEDLHNESKYNASQISVSGGSTMSSNIAGAIGAGLSMAVPQHGSSSSETKSGIADGTIIVRNDPDKDLSGLDRNPTLDDQALKNSFDAKKLEEQRELGQVAGQLGFNAAGTVADKFGWAEGSNERTLLHGIVGAVMASVGGGSASDGLKGALSSQATSAAMQYFLVSRGIDPGTSEFNALMEAASAAIGMVAGGGAGAAVALDGDKYNRQLHAPVVKAISEDLAGRYAAEQGISLEEAKGQLLRAAMSGVDGFAARYVSGLDSDEVRSSAAQFLAVNNAITPSGPQLDLSASPSEYASSKIGAASLTNDPQAYSEVLTALNPTGDAATDKALRDYFQSQGFDEQFHNWSNDDAASFLAFNGKLALVGGAGAGLAATGELGSLAVQGGWRSALSYTGLATGTAAKDYYLSGDPNLTFQAALNQHFSEQGLVRSAVVGGAGAAYLGQMFQWAGLPAAGTGWLTPAGAVLRANGAVTGNVINKATEAYLNTRAQK